MKLPPEEYYRSLPGKRMGVGVIFYNKKGEVLLVKPNYKEGWTIPGGNIEKDESPKTGAMREVKEEINLDVEELSLLCINYHSAKDIKTESIQFVFFGGVLEQEVIEKIKLQQEELLEYKFVSEDAAVELTTFGLKSRLPHCFEAIRNKKIIYLET